MSAVHHCQQRSACTQRTILRNASSLPGSAWSAGALSTNSTTAPSTPGTGSKSFLLTCSRFHFKRVRTTSWMGQELLWVGMSGSQHTPP